jgi:putative RecB family exonuclease
MNIIELKKSPHLSSSSVGDYLDCGLLYKFSRIDKIKTESTSDALVLGSSIHKALADFYQEKMIGSKLSLQDLHASFEKHWETVAGRSDIEYEDGYDWETLLKKGKDLLSVYYEKLPDDDFKVLAIEEPFSFTIDGLPPIIGVFDLLEEDPSGTIIITDWKTSSKAYSADQIDKSLQLTIYQMAIKANGYRDRDVLLRFDCLIKTKTPKFEQYYTTRSERDERRAAKKILKVWDAISKGVFLTPNETSWKCNGCAYKEHCEEWFSNED